MNDINILITGINGFLGTSLKHYIESKHPHWKVYGIDKKAEESRLKFRLNIEDKDRFKKLLLRIKPKYIFQLCGNTTSKDFKKLLNANVYTTFILLDTIKEISNYAPRIIIPSSAVEYGAMLSSRPLKESVPVRPKSYYGFSKSLQTQIALMFAKQGLNVVVARMFNVLGWAVPINLSIGRFAHELALIKKGKKKPILHTRILDTKRDFLDINDACRCLLAIALYGKQGEIYNVCRGKSHSIRYLLNKIIEISAIKGLEIIEDKSLKQMDILDSCGSTYRLKKIVKRFKPVSINKSLKDTYRYYFSRT